MSTKRKLTGQSPAERELAAHIARIQGNINGGKKRWKGTTKTQRSAIMSKVARAKTHNNAHEPRA